MVAGALDDADEAVLKQVLHSGDSDASSCPLVTRLADGQLVTVSEAAIEELMQLQLDHQLATWGAGGDGLAGVIVMCAGLFQLESNADVPICLPFDAVVESLWLKHDLATARFPSHDINTGIEVGGVDGMPPVVTVVPSAEQQPHSILRFEAAGINVVHTIVEPALGDADTTKVAGSIAAAVAKVDMRSETFGYVSPLAEQPAPTLVLDYVGCGAALAGALSVRSPLVGNSSVSRKLPAEYCTKAI